MDTPTQSQSQQQTPNQPGSANIANIIRSPPMPSLPEILEIKFQIRPKDAFDEYITALNTWKTTFETSWNDRVEKLEKDGEKSKENEEKLVNEVEKLKKEVTDLKGEVTRLKDSQRKCESCTPPCSDKNILYCVQYVQSKYGELVSSAVQLAKDTIDANIGTAKETLDLEDGPMQKKFKADFEKAFSRKTA